MTTSSLAPYNWLRKIPSELLKLDETPLFGETPEFNWNSFTHSLSKILDLDDLTIETHPLELKSADQLLEGFTDIDTLVFSIEPIASELTFIFAKDSLDSLLVAFSAKETGSAVFNHPKDSSLKQAFTQFALSEILLALQQSFLSKALSPRLKTAKDDELSLSLQASWTIDIDLAWSQGSFSGRLIIPQAFRQSWKSRFVNTSLTPSSNLMSAITLDVHLKAGGVQLSKDDWKTIKKGDFILLDSCHLIAGKDRGRVLLTILGTPFFRAKVKDGTLTILEYPLFYDVGTSMTKPKEDEVKDDTDTIFDDDEFDDEDIFAETQELTDDEEQDHEREDEEDLDFAPIKNREGSNEASSTKQLKNIEQKPFKAEDVPLDIIVEVGRFRMNIQKLSELQPGNLIPLDIHPDQGVDLVVNGLCIAKGELLKLGDNLGVRILDIAK